MEKIKLPHGEWQYDPSKPLGPKGGFGQVFVGSGNGHAKVAIKKLHANASDAAHRELSIAKDLAQLTLKSVVPIYDSGQDALSDDYFVVMDFAEGGDLQNAIRNVGKFSESEAVEILGEIASGLLEVPQYTHRDLKPLNVLKHDGHWKIADFGIARFVDESTAINTLKECLSPPYAAPEQWNQLRSTSATDVYALGCIAHSLLTGKPPFSGPAREDYRRQHLQDAAPILQIPTARLSTLVGMMLRKAPGSRPPIDRVVSILNAVKAELQNPNSATQGGAALLAAAGANDAQKLLAAEAAEATAKDIAQQRNNLKRTAVEILEQEVIEPLFQRIEDHAPTVRRLAHHRLELGTATLEYNRPTHSEAIVEGAIPSVKWDVIAIATICVNQSGAKPYQWSATLLYTDQGQQNGYRWLEMQFMSFALSSNRRQFEPYGTTDLSIINQALSKVMGTVQLGARVKPIDDEDFPAFVDRWMELFAKGSNGQLQLPHTLPIDTIN